MRLILLITNYSLISVRWFWTPNKTSKNVHQEFINQTLSVLNLFCHNIIEHFTCKNLSLSNFFNYIYIYIHHAHMHICIFIYIPANMNTHTHTNTQIYIYENSGQVHLRRKQSLINRDRHQHATSKGMDG